MSGAEIILPIICGSISGGGALVGLFDRFGDCHKGTKHPRAIPYRHTDEFREADRRFARLFDEDSPMTKEEAFECGVLAGEMGSGWREYSRQANRSSSKIQFPCVRKKVAEREREFIERGRAFSDFVVRVDSRREDGRREDGRGVRYIEDARYRRSTPPPPPYRREQSSHRRSHHSGSRHGGSDSRSRASSSVSGYGSHDDRRFDSREKGYDYPSTKPRSSRYEPRRIGF